MSVSNIRLCVNILCVDLLGWVRKTADRYENTIGPAERRLKPEEIARRVGYWELLALHERSPFQYPRRLYEWEHLTERQRQQIDTYLRPLSDGIWPRQDQFKLMRFGWRSAEGRQELPKPLEPTIPVPPLGIRPQIDNSPVSIPGLSPLIALVSETGTTLPSVPAIPPVSAITAQPSAQVRKAETEPSTHLALPQITPTPSAEAPVSLSITPLDPEQYQAVHAPDNTSLLVIAPPGTGKTHLLIERLVYLIDHLGHEAGRLLVLSFTRAAVAELKARLNQRVEQGAADDLRFVMIRSFDSLATWLMKLDLPPEHLAGRSYDERIELFNELIVNPAQLPEARNFLSNIQVLLVDEIQDLVGRRAALVLNLIRTICTDGNGCVVLLGDPAQAIYDWQVRNEKSYRIRCADFLDHVRNRLVPEIQHHSLTRYRRFVDPTMIRLAKQARKAMGDDGQAPDGTALERLIDGLGSPVSLDTVRELAHREERSAVLVRTNLEAAQLAGWCHANHIPHTLWRGAGHEHWPGWIARLVYEFKMTTMSPAMLANRWRERIGDATGLTLDEAVAYLERQEVMDGDYLDLQALTQVMTWRGPYPDHAKHYSRQGLIISTIHRSKGLEFDQVLLLEPERESAGDSEEVRVLYVAATRARHQLRLLAHDSRIFRQVAFTAKQRKYKGLRHLMTDRGACLLLDDWEDIESPLAGINIATQQDHLWTLWASGKHSARFVLEDTDRRFWLRSDANPVLRFWRASADLNFDLHFMRRHLRVLQSIVIGVRIDNLISIMPELPDGSYTSEWPLLMPVVDGFVRFQ